MVPLRQINYLATLVRFALSNGPALWLALVISVLSIVAEVAAMSVLFPLAAIASGQGGTDRVSSLFHRFGLELTSVDLLLIFLCLFSLRLLGQMVSQALISAVSKRMHSLLATRAFHNLLTVIKIRDIERETIGSYISLVGDEAFRASTVVVSLSQLVTGLLLGGLYFSAIIAFSLPTAASVLVFVAVAGLILLAPLRLSHRLGGRMIEENRVATSVFLDALNGLRSVRAFAAEAFVSAEYKAAMIKYTRTLFRVEAVNIFTRFAPGILLLLGAAGLALFPGAKDYLDGNFSFIIALVLLLMRFFPIAGQTMTIGLRVAADARAGRDVTRFVSLEATPAPPTPVHLDRQLEVIDFENLTFSHHADKALIRGANFRLRRGRSYAIVGYSGSGKSTLLDLLLKFFAPTQGRILLNGQDEAQLSEADVRKRILLVTQDTTIFNDTVRNNLRFGAEISEEEIWRALEIASAAEFVRGLPAGLDSLLSYRGTNLSGGQRQRLGLARAVARRPEVLLLDESTSALDAETRAEVVRALTDEFRDRIIVFVTHDDHVVQSVDEVLRIEDIAGQHQPA
jgi:ABC-type bacteriocin/lantibiotic exporter with double-glycine peptidase domain